MDFEIGVVGVGFARQQRLELAPFPLGFQRLQRRDPLGFGRRIAFHLAELDQRPRVVELAIDLGERPQPVLEHRALAHDLLRRLGVVPETWVFRPGVELG